MQFAVWVFDLVGLTYMGLDRRGKPEESLGFAASWHKERPKAAVMVSVTESSLARGELCLGCWCGIYQVALSCSEQKLGGCRNPGRVEHAPCAELKQTSKRRSAVHCADSLGEAMASVFSS